MAVSVHDGLDENSIWFALSYAITRVILVIEYVRTRRYVPDARELTTRYSIGYSIAAGIWFVSVFVPLPFRLFLWITGMAGILPYDKIFLPKFSIIQRISDLSVSNP